MTPEQPIHEACDAGTHDAAVAATLDLYGGEILGFLTGLLRDPDEADDVFSLFCEDVWRGLPGFAWRASLRSWCYALARHAAARHRVSPRGRPVGDLPVSQISDARLAAHAPSTVSAVRERTRVTSGVRRLRESLPLDDQALLVLRIDRGLSWDEVAHALAAPGTELEDEELRRATARARKRFQLVKERLRELARAEGLL